MRPAGFGDSIAFEAYMMSLESMDVSSLPSLKILIVDDHADTVETTRMLLQVYGYTVATAQNAREALTQALSFCPDVVLLDLGLPEVSGIELAKLIREQEEAGTTLIAMTGWSRAEDMRRAHDAGFDHFLVKPVDLQELLQLLRKRQQIETTSADLNPYV